jgi:class 3 adenylate cyclase
MHSLSAHFAVSCGPIQFALLGGVNDEWTHLMNGPCISELTVCIDSAPPQSVACTKICLENAQQVQPLITASRVGDGVAYLLNDFHHISKQSVRIMASGKNVSSSSSSGQDTVSNRIACLSSKGSQGHLLVSIPSSTTPVLLGTNSSLSSPVSPGFNLDAQLTGQLARSISDEAAALESKAVGSSSVRNADDNKTKTDDSKAYVEKMVRKASFFVPKPVLSSLTAGTLKSIAELRTITTMFVNLDSYSLKDNMDPLSLQPFFVLLQEILSKSGGFLRQFLIDDKGCVAIAMWGVPTYNHSNNCYRGLYCAWNLLTRVSELNHRVSIGLTNGPAYCGIVGSTLRRDYAGIGDKVNIAARLMAKAKGKVLVDPDVYMALDGTEKKCLLPYQELQLKGMKLPMTPYMFTEDADLSDFRDQDADHHTNTIVRQDVMKKLLAVLDQSVQGTPFLSRLKIDPANSRNSDLKSAILIDINLHNDHSGHGDDSGDKYGDKFDTAGSLNNDPAGILSGAGAAATSARRGTIRSSVKRIGSLFGMNTSDENTASIGADAPSGAQASRKRSVLILNTENVSEKRSERRRSVIKIDSNFDNADTNDQFTPKGTIINSGGKFSSSKYILGMGGKASSNAALTGFSTGGISTSSKQGGPASDNNTFIVMCGVTGTGKSTALQFFKLSALRRKLRFVSTCCRQEDESVPFAVIRKLFWEIAGKAKHNTNALKKQCIHDLLNQTRTEEGAKYVASADSHLVFQELLLEKEKRSEEDLLNEVGDDGLDRKLENNLNNNVGSSQGGAGRNRVSNLPLTAIADYEEDDYDPSVDAVNLHSAGRKQSVDFDDSSSNNDGLGSGGLNRTFSGSKSGRTRGVERGSTISALSKADPQETNYLFTLMLEILLSNFPTTTIAAIEDAQYCDEQSLSLLALVQQHKMKIVVLLTILQQGSSSSSIPSAVSAQLNSPDSPNKAALATANTAPTTPLTEAGVAQGSEAKEDFRAMGSASIELYVASKTLQISANVSGKTAMNNKSGGAAGGSGVKSGQAIFNSAQYLGILGNPCTISIEMKPLTSPEINIVLKQLLNSKITATPIIGAAEKSKAAQPTMIDERRRSIGLGGSLVMNKIEEKSEERMDVSGASGGGQDSTKGSGVGNNSTNPNSNVNSRRNSDNNSGELSASGEQTVPPHLVKKIFEMTSGNAVWVKVIGRFIKEFGVQDFINTTEKGSSSDCLRNLIICRLEKLSLEQQIVLKHAAVIGFEFSVRSLAAIVPESTLPRLTNTVSVLCELGFIHCVEETPLAVFGFQHKLTRDTIYSMMPHRYVNF